MTQREVIDGKPATLPQEVPKSQHRRRFAAVVSSYQQRRLFMQIDANAFELSKVRDFYKFDVHSSNVPLCRYNSLGLISNTSGHRVRHGKVKRFA
jgi:hypothetical protein